ncbi:2OG-Fe dioxygenase family protein [Nocardia thraciensis]
MAAQLREWAAATDGHAEDAGRLLAQQDSVGVLGDRVREMLGSHRGGAVRLRDEALVLADQADGAANEAEKTLCVMFAFGIQLVGQIAKALVVASAAGPAGQVAAAPVVESMLVKGRVEVEVMRAGLKQAFARGAADTVVKLTGMGPLRLVGVVGRSAVVPVVVDGGVQGLQVVEGNRELSVVGVGGENPRGIDVRSVVAGGVAGAGGAVGGVVAGRLVPRFLPRVQTSRVLMGLVQGTAGAVSGLGAAAMITGWPEHFDQVLASMLNGGFAGTVQAQPGIHAKSGFGTRPVVDGSEMFTRPDLPPARPPVKISAESEQAWETARKAWNTAPDKKFADGSTAGAGRPAPTPSEPTPAGHAMTPRHATATAVAPREVSSPASAGGESAQPKAGVTAAAPATGQRTPGNDPASGPPRVTASPESAAPPKIPDTSEKPSPDHTADTAGRSPVHGEGSAAGRASDEHAPTTEPHPAADAAAGRGTRDANHPGGENQVAATEAGTSTTDRSGNGRPGATAEDGTLSAHGPEGENPSAAAENGTSANRAVDEYPGATAEDGAETGPRAEGEAHDSTAESGASGAEAVRAAGESESEGAGLGSRGRAEEVLADFHARSADSVPDGLKLSNLSDEALQAGLFHPDERESLIAGMEIIRRGTMDGAPGGMVLRGPQLEGGFEMARRPVQMLPSQGKTLMFMSYSLHQAVRSLREPGGGSVLLVTTADGLAHREFVEYKRVLSRYGVDVLRADQNAGFGAVTPGRPAIVLATGETVGHLCNAGHSPPRRAVIDEMDAIVDRGEKRFIRSGLSAAEAPEATAREVFAAHDFLADALAKGQLSHEDFGLKQLSEEVDVQLPDGSFEVGTEFWYDGQAALTPAGRAKVEALPGGEQWLTWMGSSRLDMAAAAEFTTRNKTHYVMDQGKIVIIDQNEHGLQRNLKTRFGGDDGKSDRESQHAWNSSESRWSAEPGKASLAQAVEAKEIRAAEAKGVSAEQHGIVVRADADSVESITAAEIYGTDRFFDHITGASGTLTDLGDVLKIVYGMEAPHAVDPFNPSRLVEGQADVHENTRAKLTALAGYAHEMWDGGQGRFQEILCHRNDLVDKQVQALLRAGIPRDAIEPVDADRIAKWGADWETKLQQVFDAAGEQGKILVINRQGQRGVDISVSDAVLAKGGMHVWMTEVPEQSYIYDQAKNRTARNGKPGTAQALMSPQDELIRKAMHLRGVREAVVRYQDAVAAHRDDPTSATHDKVVDTSRKLVSLVRGEDGVSGLQARAHYHATADFIRTYAPIIGPEAPPGSTQLWYPEQSEDGQSDRPVDRSRRLAALLGVPAPALAAAVAGVHDLGSSADPGTTDDRTVAVTGTDDALRDVLHRARLSPAAVEALWQQVEASSPAAAVQYALFTDEQAIDQLVTRRKVLAELLDWDPARIEGAEGMRDVGAALADAQHELAAAIGKAPSDITPATVRDIVGESVALHLSGIDSRDSTAIDATGHSATHDPRDSTVDIDAMASYYLATAALLELVTEIHRRSPNNCVNNAVTAMRMLCPKKKDRFRFATNNLLAGQDGDQLEDSFGRRTGDKFGSLDKAVESLKQRPGGIQVLVYKWKQTEQHGSSDADNHLVVLVNDSDRVDDPKLVVVDLAASRDGRSDDDFGPADLADSRTLLNKAVEFDKWQREQQKYLGRLKSQQAFWTIDFDAAGDLVPERSVRDMPPAETLDEPVPVDAALENSVNEAIPDGLADYFRIPEWSPATDTGPPGGSNTSRPLEPVRTGSRPSEFASDPAGGQRATEDASTRSEATRPDPFRASREELAHWATRLTAHDLHTYLTETHADTTGHIAAVRQGRPPAVETVVGAARTQTALVAEQWRRIADGGPGSAIAVADAADRVFEIIGALCGAGTRTVPEDDLEILNRFPERAVAAAELGAARIVDGANWARLADDHLVRGRDGDWDPELMRALRELPSRSAEFAAARTASDRAFGEVAGRYIPDAYRAALYFLTCTRDTEQATARLRDLDHAMAAAVDRLGSATPAVTAGLSLLQLRMDIHQAMAGAGGAAASAMRSAVRHGLVENPSLPQMMQRMSDDLGSLARYGDDTQRQLRPSYSTRRITSEDLRDDDEERSSTVRARAIGVHGGSLVESSGPALEPLRTEQGGVSFLMDPWGRMIAGNDHESLLRLMAAMGDELSGWGTLATDDNGRPDGQVRPYRHKEIFDPMGTAQLRDALSRGGLHLDDTEFDSESQGSLWRGDPAPLSSLFGANADGFHRSVDAVFSGYSGHFWVKPVRDGIRLRPDEIRVPLTLAPLRREPGHIEVVANREGDRTIVGYRDPAPGAEPAQVARVFAELHQRMVRWVAESDTVEWHPDTAETVDAFARHVSGEDLAVVSDLRPATELEGHIGSRPSDTPCDDAPTDGLSLSFTETAILAQARNGATHNDIATALGISEHDVRASLAGIRRKIRNKRAQLVTADPLVDPSTASELDRFRAAMYAALVGADQPDPRQLIEEASAEQLERVVRGPVSDARRALRFVSGGVDGSVFRNLTLLAARRAVHALAAEYNRSQAVLATALAEAGPADLRDALDELGPAERRILINRFGSAASPATVEPEDSVRGLRAVEIVRLLATSIATRAETPTVEENNELLTAVRHTNYAAAQTYTVNECLDAVVEWMDRQVRSEADVDPARHRQSLPVDHGFDDEQRRTADTALRAGGFRNADELRRWGNRLRAEFAQRRATENGDWWDSLRDPDQPGGLSSAQRALIQVYPHQIGNADGLPAVLRDHANRLSIQRDLDDFLARKPSGTEILEWARTGLTAADRRRLGNLVHTRNHLREMDRQAAEMPGSPPVHLLSYDSTAFRGKGKAVAALGNVDTAHTVNWHVPGTGTTSSSLAYQFKPLRNLYSETRKVDPSLELASIVWIGYDAPAGSLYTGYVKAAFRRRAQIGGDRLLCDIAAFHASRSRAGTATSDRLVNRLYGYSYGSVATSYAGRAGRLAGLIGSVILSGSPGAGPLVHAADFGIGAHNVFVLASWRDVVTTFGADEPGVGSRYHRGLGLGLDPASEVFGGERLGAEFPDSAEFTGVLAVHVGYLRYDPATGQPTEALRHSAHITAGRGDTLARVPRRRPGNGRLAHPTDAERGRYADLLDRQQGEIGELAGKFERVSDEVASALTIEAATAADIGPLAEQFGHSWILEDRLQRQARGDGVLFVARRDGRPVAHGYLWLEDAEEPEIRSGLPGVALINHMRVAEGFRGRHIDGELIAHMERYARVEAGRDRVALAVLLSNTAAARLYERLGYVDWGQGSVQCYDVVERADGSRVRVPDPEKARVLVKDLTGTPGDSVRPADTASHSDPTAEPDGLIGSRPHDDREPSSPSSQRRTAADPDARLAVAYHLAERRGELLRALSALLAPHGVDPVKLLRTASPTWETWFARYQELRGDLVVMLEIERGTVVDDEWIRHVLTEWRAHGVATPEIISAGLEFERYMPVARLVDDIQRLDTWASTIEEVEADLIRRTAELSALLGQVQGLMRAAAEFRPLGELARLLDSALVRTDRLAVARQHLEEYARDLFSLGTAVAESESAPSTPSDSELLAAARPYRLSSLDSWHGMALLHARLRYLVTAHQDPDNEMSVPADIEELRRSAARANAAVERDSTSLLLNTYLDATLDLVSRVLAGVPAAQSEPAWRLSESTPESARIGECLSVMRAEFTKRPEPSAQPDDIESGEYSERLDATVRPIGEISRARWRLGRIDTVIAALDEAGLRTTLGQQMILRRIGEHLREYPLDRRIVRDKLSSDVATIRAAADVCEAALPGDDWTENESAQGSNQTGRYLSLRHLVEAFDDVASWRRAHDALRAHVRDVRASIDSRRTAEVKRASSYSKLRDLAASIEMDLSRWRSIPELREELQRRLNRDWRQLGAMLDADTPESERQSLEAPADALPTDSARTVVVKLISHLDASRPEDLAAREHAEQCHHLFLMVGAVEAIIDRTAEIDSFEADLDEWLDSVLDTVGRAVRPRAAPDTSGPDGLIGSRPSDGPDDARDAPRSIVMPEDPPSTEIPHRSDAPAASDERTTPWTRQRTEPGSGTKATPWPSAVSSEAVGHQPDDAPDTSGWRRIPHPHAYDHARDWLRAVREGLSLLPEQMDTIIGAPPGTWSDIESGARQLTTDELRALMRHVPAVQRLYAPLAQHFFPALVSVPPGVGASLRFFREAAGLTPTRFAQRLGVLEVTVTNRESVSRLPPVTAGWTAHVRALAAGTGPIDDTADIGACLETLRKRVGLPLRHMAARLGLAPDIVGDIEAGRRQPDRTEVEAYLCALTPGRPRYPEGYRRTREYLRFLREDAGVQVREAARRAGMSPNMINHRESGRTKLSPEFVELWLREYGQGEVSFDQIVDVSECPEDLGRRTEAHELEAESDASANMLSLVPGLLELLSSTEADSLIRLLSGLERVRFAGYRLELENAVLLEPAHPRVDPRTGAVWHVDGLRYEASVVDHRGRRMGKVGCTIGLDNHFRLAMDLSTSGLERTPRTKIFVDAFIDAHEEYAAAHGIHRIRVRPRGEIAVLLARRGYEWSAERRHPLWSMEELGEAASSLASAATDADRAMVESFMNRFEPASYNQPVIGPTPAEVADLQGRSDRRIGERLLGASSPHLVKKMLGTGEDPVAWTVARAETAPRISPEVEAAARPDQPVAAPESAVSTSAVDSAPADLSRLPALPDLLFAEVRDDERLLEQLAPMNGRYGRFQLLVTRARYLTPERPAFDPRTAERRVADGIEIHCRFSVNDSMFVDDFLTIELDPDGRTVVRPQYHHDDLYAMFWVRFENDYYARWAYRTEFQVNPPAGALIAARLGVQWQTERPGSLERTIDSLYEGAARVFRSVPSVSPADRRLVSEILSRFDDPARDNPTPRELLELTGDCPRLGKNLMFAAPWDGVLHHRGLADRASGPTDLAPPSDSLRTGVSAASTATPPPRPIGPADLESAPPPRALLDVREPDNALLSKAFGGPRQYGRFRVEVTAEYGTTWNVVRDASTRVRRFEGVVHNIQLHGDVFDQDGRNGGNFSHVIERDQQGRIIVQDCSFLLPEAGRIEPDARLGADFERYYRHSRDVALVYLDTTGSHAHAAAVAGYQWNFDAEDDLDITLGALRNRAQGLYADISPADRERVADLLEQFDGPLAEYPSPATVAEVTGDADDLGLSLLDGPFFAVKILVSDAPLSQGDDRGGRSDEGARPELPGNRPDPDSHTDPAIPPTPWSRPGAERPRADCAEPDGGLVSTTDDPLGSTPWTRDDPAQILRGLEGVHNDLHRDGYSIVDEALLGIDSAVRRRIAHRYFHEGVLKPESHDAYPPDRLRARDVVRYEWTHDESALKLAEHDDISIVTPADLIGVHPHLQRRVYERVRVLDDSNFGAVVRGMLELVPPDRRYRRGTFSVNLFRTSTNVVSGPHQDGDQYVFVYVIDKNALGGETVLYTTERRRVVSVNLQPGQLLVFEDARFLHSATPLRPESGTTAARRDTLVCTVNKPETYPW